MHLHRLGKSGKDRVREVGDEETDRVRRLDASWRDVEEVAHRALDALLRLGSHGGRAARDTRGGAVPRRGRGCGGVLGYPLEQLSEEVAFVAYHFHWPEEEIMRMEHADRRGWVTRISKLNQRANGD